MGHLYSTFRLPSLLLNIRMFYILVICFALFQYANCQCSDSTTSCSAWNNNGFCDSSFYSTETKKQQCAKTCNLCNGGGAGTPPVNGLYWFYSSKWNMLFLNSKM